MTVPEWTDPGSLTAVSGVAASADFNAMLENLRFLHEAPQAAVRLTSSQEVASGSDSIVEWDQAVWDEWDMWDDSSPGVLVIPRQGLWLFNVGVLWEQQDTPSEDIRRVFLHVDDNRRRGDAGLATNPHESSTTFVTSLAEHDAVDFRVRQGSGGALDLQATRTVAVALWVSEFFAGV